MQRPHLLHMITPDANVSPFDVNMGYDAGFDAVCPYTSVALKDVRSLVQDMIFSRSVNDVKRTACFIGGRDASLALDMLDKAKDAMVPPYEISCFPDPAGSFTTAAAMVACTELLLRNQFKTTFKGLKVKIFGGKGIVGSISGVIAAKAGAEATLVGYDGVENVQRKADEYKARFGVTLLAADGSTEDLNTKILTDADIVFCAARAGVQVLTKKQLATAPQVKIVADVNAVPPAGVEGVGVHDSGAKLESGALALGALAIGDYKIKTQRELLVTLCNSEKPVYLNFMEATEVARKLVGLS